jgi:hypothetical protein
MHKPYEEKNIEIMNNMLIMDVNLERVLINKKPWV